MEQERKTRTINTIEHAVYVARLPKTKRVSQWYLGYDYDNLYPNKVKSMAERSITCTTASITHADFLSGQGFGEGLNEIIVNDEEQTLEEILKTSSKDKSIFNGMALHFNYNRIGEIIEINEIPFEGLRWSRDMSRLYFAEDWSKVNRISQVTEYRPFNPENAVNEINEDGIENYTGQVIYWIPKKREIYTTCRFDAALNHVQFEDESSIFQLRGIQNDFPIGGILKLPIQLFDDGDEQGLASSLKFKHKGAKNANSWLALPFSDSEEMKGKIFEATTRQNVDSMFTNQNEHAKSCIYETYQQPPILNGKSFGGMFNQDQFIDAFDYYNSKTEDERTDLEKFFNKFWSYTIWSSGEKLEIIPKDYIIKREGSQNATNND